MTFDEALQAILAQPGSSFTGFGLSRDGLHFSCYIISNDPEDPEWVAVSYEGGRLFSSSGEEESYSLEDVPGEAKTLNYRPSADLPEVGGLTSDHALFALFPGLPDPETVWGVDQQNHFAAQALLCATASDLVTVTGEPTK